MPHVVVIGGTGDNRLTLLDLVNRVNLCAGLGQVTTVETTTNLQTLEVIELLHEIQQELFDVYQGKDRKSQAEWFSEIVPGLSEYIIVDGFQEMRAKPSIGEVNLSFRPLDVLLSIYSNIQEEGRPCYYTQDQGYLKLVPCPDEAFMTGRRVLHGVDTYVCILPHIAGEDDDEPGVGANWQTYWILSASQTSTDAWAAGTPYKTGRLYVPFYSVPMRMRLNNDYPTLNPEYYPALIQGACWRMKDFLQRAETEVQRAERRYVTLATDRKAAGRFPYDAPQRQVEPL